MDPLADFKDEFARTERSIHRTTSMMLIFCVVWVVFLMCAIGAGLFILGRWTGVW